MLKHAQDMNSEEKDPQAIFSKGGSMLFCASQLLPSIILNKVLKGSSVYTWFIFFYTMSKV